MRSLFVFTTCLLVVLVSGCDAGHGHYHDDKTPNNNHKSID